MYLDELLAKHKGYGSIGDGLGLSGDAAAASVDVRGGGQASAINERYHSQRWSEIDGSDETRNLDSANAGPSWDQVGTKSGRWHITSGAMAHFLDEVSA